MRPRPPTPPHENPPKSYFALIPPLFIHRHVQAGYSGSEILVRRHDAGQEVHVHLPLWPPPALPASATSPPDAGEGKEGKAGASEGSPSATTGRDSSFPSVLYRLHLHLAYALDPVFAMTGATSTDSHDTVITAEVVAFPVLGPSPSPFPLLQRTLLHTTCGPPSSGGSLPDFLEGLRRRFLQPFLTRRDFVRALWANFIPVEHDAGEFATATILLPLSLRGERARDEGGGEAGTVGGAQDEVRGEEEEEEVLSFLLHFSFPWDFPGVSPPDVSYSDLARGRTGVPVGREDGQWRYSPRWEGKRMAQALVEHARGVIRSEYATASRTGRR